MEVMFFPNGNTAVIENGKQVPELQESWLTLFAEFLKGKGIDPIKATYLLPSGYVEIFETSDGSYNWRMRT